MTEIVSDIGVYLMNVLSGIDVRPGLLPDTAEQPLQTPAVFIIVQSIDNGRAELTFSVHVPLCFGGMRCIGEAERVSELLKSSDCPVRLEDVVVGKAVYSRNSRALVCSVSAYAVKSESKRYYFRAEYFEYDEWKIVSCGISDYTIRRRFEVYPIMTIFGDRPIDIIDRENVYDITLPDVPSLFIDDLSHSGRFRLTVNGMAFDNCYCVESVEDKTKRCTVTVRGYTDSLQSGDIGGQTPAT